MIPYSMRYADTTIQMPAYRRQAAIGEYLFIIAGEAGERPGA
jgi:hypothetical protein